MNKNSVIALYTAAQVRELDRVAIEAFGLPAYELMVRAGEGLYKQSKQRWPDAQSITVCCGAGNNAGDGYVVARLLKEAGCEVEVVWLTDPGALSGIARQAADAYLGGGGKAAEFSATDFPLTDLIIDALFGTGLARDVTGAWRAAIEAINASAAPVLSADVPSGLEADTGQVLGVAVQACSTLTFIGRKRGLYTAAGVQLAGDIGFDDLHVPARVYAKVPADTYLLDAAVPGELLPPRKRDSHKGHYGHVLVVGGDRGMAGAVRLAAEAAVRTGSGLVSVATRATHAVAISAVCPELMCHGVDDAAGLHPLIEKATVIVIGPGLGQAAWGQHLLMEVLQTSLPLVIDADALNLIAREPLARGNWVMTPHPGEAARLLQTTTAAIQADRFAAVRQIGERYQATTLLKGAGSLVTAPNELVALCDRGNPGMASGGMGDVLSGVIGGLIAQGLDQFEAAQTGVVVHAQAADTAAVKGGERGLLASDVIAGLRGAINADR